jgi:hypothetical protein
MLTSIVMSWYGAEMFVIETNVSLPAYDLLLGLEVLVKEVLTELPGNGSPGSPLPAILIPS